MCQLREGVRAGERSMSEGMAVSERGSQSCSSKALSKHSARQSGSSVRIGTARTWGDYGRKHASEMDTLEFCRGTERS